MLAHLNVSRSKGSNWDSGPRVRRLDQVSAVSKACDKAPMNTVFPVREKPVTPSFIFLSNIKFTYP